MANNKKTTTKEAMKNRIKKNKAILFICSFFGFLAISILLAKSFDFFKMGPATWKDIENSLFSLIIFALIFTAWMTWGGVGDNLIEFFAEKRRKRKEKEENERV